MRIDIITLFPELLQSPFTSIVKRALEGGKSRNPFPQSARLQQQQIQAGRRLSLWWWRRDGDDD